MEAHRGPQWFFWLESNKKARRRVVEAYGVKLGGGGKNGACMRAQGGLFIGHWRLTVDMVGCGNDCDYSQEEMTRWCYL